MAELASQTITETKQKKFLTKFPKLPEDEKLLHFFSATYRSENLLRGQFFISNNCVCFASNVIGYITKLVIPIATIETITKERSGYFFPLQIVLQTKERPYIFCNFNNRDLVFNLLTEIHKRILKEQKDEEDFEAESSDSEESEEQEPENSIEIQSFSARKLILQVCMVLIVLLSFSALFMLNKLNNRLQENAKIMNLEDDDLFERLYSSQAKLYEEGLDKTSDLIDINLKKIAHFRQSLETISNLLPIEKELK